MERRKEKWKELRVECLNGISFSAMNARVLLIYLHISYNDYAKAHTHTHKNGNGLLNKFQKTH